MRECHRNYAHGPMKLKTETVAVDYRGECYHCQKTVYACTICDFEFEQPWMQEKMEAWLKEAHTQRHGDEESR